MIYGAIGAAGVQLGGVAEPLGRFLWSWPKKASQTPKGKPLGCVCVPGIACYSAVRRIDVGIP